MSSFPRVATRRLFRVVNGGTPRADAEFWDGDVAWATPVDLGAAHGRVISTTERTLTRAGLETGSRAVPIGSLILSTRAPIGYISEAGTQMAFNQGCRGLVPQQDLDSRFYRYTFVALADGLSSYGQGSTFFELSSDSLAEFPIPLPTLHEQRAIADFLDAETARIDSLIEKKRKMVALLEEKRTRILEELCTEVGVILPTELDSDAFDSLDRPRSWTVIRLSQALKQLTNGYVGPTRDILQSDGVPYIQSLHIKRGRIDFDRRPYYVSREWYLARPRIALRPNDVLIVQTGDIGQIALVPETLGEASCHALLIARVNRDIITGPYLAAYLQSHLGYHSLLRMATGALHPHLESSIKDVRIVAPPIDNQESFVREIKRRQGLLDQTMDSLEQQMRLLTEHRQALITAAVTGQVEVPEIIVAR